MDIIQPILDEANKKEVIKIRNRVLTAKIIVFILAGAGFIYSFLDLVKPTEPNTHSWLTDGLAGVIYLILGLLCGKKPFIPMLLATLLVILSSIYSFFDFFSQENLNTPEITGFFLGQFCLIFFMFRGLLNAWKLKTELH